MEPLARGWRNGVFLIYFFGWVVKPLGYWTGEWFFAQYDCGLSGWYVLCRSVCCGGQSELSGRNGYASPLSLRPVCGVDHRLSDRFRGRADEFKRMCALLLSRVRSGNPRNFVEICSNCNICSCCRQRYRANCNRGQTSGLWFCKQEFDDSMT